jgi:deoxyribonuclease-4
MWRTKPPDREQVRLFKQRREEYDLVPLAIHDSYLINLAAPPSIVREKSIDGFSGELERALIIGADYVVAHPGSYKGLTREQGILNVAEALALAWRQVAPELKRHARPTILLENTAGAGAQLGGDLEELATIRQLVTPHLDLAVGYCLDTCHCYVSGFDLANEKGLEALLKRARETLGLENIFVMHMNDSKAPLNSHLDRHANIGDGYIGLEGFRRILNHPDLHQQDLRDRAFILETPVDEPGDDLRNMMALKELVSPKKRLTLKQSSPSGTRAGAKIPRSM